MAGRGLPRRALGLRAPSRAEQLYVRRAAAGGGHSSLRHGAGQGGRARHRPLQHAQGSGGLQLLVLF